MKKYKLFIWLVAALLLIIVSVIFINASVYDIDRDRNAQGIQDIKIEETKSGEKVLYIKHGWGLSDGMHYSVRVMEETEKVYMGERLVEYDGSLGKYRIEILFGDTKASRAFISKYPLGKAHKIIDCPEHLKSLYKIRLVSPPDDSMYIIYIGSDEPIYVDSKEQIKTGGQRGTIEIVLK